MDTTTYLEPDNNRVMGVGMFPVVYLRALVLGFDSTQCPTLVEAMVSPGLPETWIPRVGQLYLAFD